MFYDLYEICRKDKQRSRSVVTKGQWEVGMKNDCLISMGFYFVLFFYFFFKLSNIVLVLPNIKMNPPQVILE